MKGNSKKVEVVVKVGALPPDATVMITASNLEALHRQIKSLEDALNEVVSQRDDRCLVLEKTMNDKLRAAALSHEKEMANKISDNQELAKTVTCQARQLAELRDMIEGSTTGPTMAEQEKHMRAGGTWRSNGQRIERIWPIDELGRVVPWPKVVS